jgi:hypothetical protein
MVSLWGSKKDGDDPEADVQHNGNGNGAGAESSTEPPAPRQSVEANEHTRLLPPPAEGYLSPDDPAVRT